MKSKLLSAVAGGLILALGASTVSAEDIRLRGTIGSPVSPSAQIITVISNNIAELDPDISVEISGGQPGTRQILQAAMGEADIHIMPPLLTQWLAAGEGPYEEMENGAELEENLRLMMMYPGGTFQMVVREDSGIRSFDDLAGTTLSFGARGGALTRIMTGMIEAATGLKADEDYEVIALDAASQLQGYQDGQVDNYFRFAPVGFADMQQVAAVAPMRVVGLTAEQAELPAVVAVGESPGRAPAVIPAGTYGDAQTNEEDVYTYTDWVGIGIPVSVSDDVAYAITKTFWDNLDELRSIAPWAEAVQMEDFARFANVPVHPGAARFYEEQGLEVPSIE